MCLMGSRFSGSRLARPVPFGCRSATPLRDSARVVHRGTPGTDVATLITHPPLTLWKPGLPGVTLPVKQGAWPWAKRGHCISCALLFTEEDTMDRIACNKCGAMILPTTAKATDGQCMPCAKKKKAAVEAERRLRLTARYSGCRLWANCLSRGIACSDSCIEQASMVMPGDKGFPRSEYYLLTNRGQEQEVVLHAMKNSKGEILDDASKVDDVSIVLQQDQDSGLGMGDRLHGMADSLLGIFVIHRKVLAVFQEYRVQPHTIVSKCIILDNSGTPMPNSDDYCVMHFDFAARYNCTNRERKPITNGVVLPPYTYHYCHKHLIPQLDFFEDSLGWMFSAILIQRIIDEGFTNFAFDRLIVE